MSPREKQLLSFITVALFGLLVAVLWLYFIPAFPYVTLFIGLCCVVFYYHKGDSFYTKLGLNPRRGLRVPPVLRRWLSGRSAETPGRFRSLHNKVDGKYSEVHTRQRPTESSLYRREALASETFLFSPRDILMGSYISKEGHAERPRAGQSLGANPNPRELLRERLSRPNHAVHTPNRRLSFTRDPVGTTSKFVITPQRHYPLLQSGTASLGVLPPAHWDSFKRKNILSPRNSTMLHSPVTVKIARPDHSNHRPPTLDYAGYPGLSFPPDPSSTEGVLKVLKESRKRDVVEDGDGSFTAEQLSKRRRNDSGGSTHSAFEPLLPNGMSTQLVPKPGTLKRGPNSLEDAAVKRSRTSSISSGSPALAPGAGGTPGSTRNPINSSYSSSRGLPKWKRTLEECSPLSSPGGSRSQTPERALKKPREEDVLSSGSVSVVTPEQTANRITVPTSQRAPVASVGTCAPAESTGSGGKRKRKIQLVSSHREDQIYLPPPPELGYTVTGRDLDLEKKDALSKIQKSLEEPAPETAGVAPAPLPSAVAPAFSSATTLSSLLASPLTTATTAPVGAGAPIPVINLDPTPSQPAAAAASNPLLEALNSKSATPSSAPPTPLSITVSSSAEAPAQRAPSSLTPTLLVQPGPAVPGPPAGAGGSGAPSAFTQVLSQAPKPAAGASALPGHSLFGVAAPPSAASAPPTSAPPAYTLPTASGAGTAVAGGANPLLASGFKPIFTATPPSSSAPAPAPESKPALPNFKPLFGSAAAGAAFGAMATTAAPTAPTATFGVNAAAAAASSLFPPSTTAASAAPAAAPPSAAAAAQPAVTSMFGAWGASATTVGTTATSTPTLASNTGSGFQFGAAPAAATTTAPARTVAAAAMFGAAKANGTFTFGSVAAAPATTQAATTQAATTQAAPQNMFGFGQAAPAQGKPAVSFGGFALAAAAAAPVPAAQSTFTFAKSAFNAAGPAAAPSAFPGLASAAPKPFGFGTSAPAANPAAAPAASPFSFGAATAPASTFGASSTTASTFGASSTTASTFGASSTTASTFGASSTTASTFGASSTSTFGASSTTASTFGASSAPASTFGAPAKPAFGAGSTGFAFGASAAPAAAPAVAAAPTAAPTFGITTQTQSAATSTFTFGGAPAQAAALPAQPASGGFNFGSAMPSAPFGQPATGNAAPQMAGFNFGAASADKPAFGTPTFGQSAAAAPSPFGSPATPIQSFNPAAAPHFGSPATPSFSIGAGSKPSGARQRLQARRQHTRKK